MEVKLNLKGLNFSNEKYKMSDDFTCQFIGKSAGAQ
jgi:hypothetical protein